MYLEEFPRCCGIDVITGLFGSTEDVWDPINNYWRPWQKTDTIKLIEEYLLETKGERRGLVLAVTNRLPAQIRSAKLLQEFGFTELYKFYNPRHRSHLTMWHLKIGKLTKTQIRARTKKLVKKYDRSK